MEKRFTNALLFGAGAVGLAVGARGAFALHRIREQQQALLFEPVEERPSLT